MPSILWVRSSPFSPSSSSSSPIPRINSRAFARFLATSSSSLAAASSRRLASARYSEKHFSPNFDIEPDQETKLTIPSFVLASSFLFFFVSLFFFETLTARGARAAGRWGPAPKCFWVPAPELFLTI